MPTPLPNLKTWEDGIQSDFFYAWRNKFGPLLANYFLRKTNAANKPTATQLLKTPPGKPLMVSSLIDFLSAPDQILGRNIHKPHFFG